MAYWLACELQDTESMQSTVTKKVMTMTMFEYLILIAIDCHILFLRFLLSFS